MHRYCCSRKFCSSRYRHRNECQGLCCYTWSYCGDNAHKQSTRAPSHRHVAVWWCRPRDPWVLQPRGSWMATHPMWTAISGLEATTAAPAEMALACACAPVAVGTGDQMLQSAAACCLLQALEKAHWRQPASRSRKFWRRARRQCGVAEVAIAVALGTSCSKNSCFREMLGYTTGRKVSRARVVEPKNVRGANSRGQPSTEPHAAEEMRFVALSYR